jgi:predicted dehydrogenase
MTTSNLSDERIPLKVGVLGAGGIATIADGVLPNMRNIDEAVDIVAIADLVPGRATEVARRFGIPEAYTSLEQMLEDADIDAVVNLTPIPAHAATSAAILRAGKHLVVEKPIATSLAEADEIIGLAAANDLVLACAPPDMLFGPYTEARRLIQSGVIGDVAFARVRSSHAGPGGGAEPWPLDPSWFYRDGSGPLFDMGVYGIHEITGLLGPARRVTAFAGITDATRTVRFGPFAGTVMPVDTPDNCLFMLDFGNSRFAVIDATFNVHASRSPKVEVFGRKGVVNIYTPDGPNVEVFRTDIVPGLDGWAAPTAWPITDSVHRDRLGRAVLVEHLARCVRTGERPVLSGEHARHALEIMLAVTESAREGRVVELTTTF